MDLGIRGRRAVVAASSSGLGLGAAKHLSQAGCQVVISGRDQTRLEEAVGLVPGSIPIQADVSTASGAEALIEAAVGELGGVDILVPNAGGPPPGTFSSSDVSSLAPALEQNLVAMAAMCKKAVPMMRAQRWGRVVAITSLSVRQPIPNLILSNTARAGLTAYLKTLALEVIGDGVTVNTVQPGLHLTPRVIEIYGDRVGDAEAQVPAGRAGDPDDFGAVVAFLCSEQANFITGASIPVGGGADRGLQ